MALSLVSDFFISIESDMDIDDHDHGRCCTSTQLGGPSLSPFSPKKLEFVRGGEQNILLYKMVEISP